MEKTVVELFAGVGGFRLGLERLNTDWETVWFSQWEPGKTKQWAHDCYVKHFGDSPDLDGNYTTGIDIAEVDKTKIPDHTLLVGGFPCQDYSVAHPLSSSQGLEGKKGVLWWQIRDTLIAKHPPFCLFENVDRLLKSPAKQRGRDFGVILACLNELGYCAEWRVVNAATYGAAQRRRRTFIFAYRKDTNFATIQSLYSEQDILGSKGFFATTFPVSPVDVVSYTTLPNDVVEVSDTFKYDFSNGGFMRDGIIYTAPLQEKEEAPVTIGSLLQSNADDKYFITSEAMAKWSYLKGAKKVPRKSSSGYEYIFSEGPVAFPDAYNKPGRTMLTSEGTLNRSTHVVADPARGMLRILTPVETERLQGFDDNWTDTGMPERFRYFCMGNALVVPMITRMGKTLDEIISGEI